MAWNVDVSRVRDGSLIVTRPPTPQNYAIGTRGSVIGNWQYWRVPGAAGHIEGTTSSRELHPRSLYDAQLAARGGP